MIDAVQEPLLVVEDSNEDFRMLQRLMQRFEVKNPIYRCSDGDEVLNYLYHKGAYDNPRKAPRPSVILLDLNLPGVDGRYVLERIKQDITFREIPIVVFTTSSNPEDIELCYQKGANGYLIKPMDYKELHNIMRAFVNYWLEANVAPMIKY
ncbi:response regulator [Dulcicalothrix desertica PCC 7102]|uniref:Response regulator n=1 Tax=Dulcicalothrix desertica PCC 7102 TaxID=232991 RepID=A0A433VHF5_9CYAN|nr:response regulator [Dulcicalothrix desertica]RUT05528.1 response regulator [Dulcicalothrix desertica PCC 7102]TWH54625.1 CheY-like chemotaxis protein [Dulcicalothrix desertica PCC 7102]